MTRSSASSISDASIIVLFRRLRQVPLRLEHSLNQLQQNLVFVVLLILNQRLLQVVLFLA